jgi:hypothetical protein
MRPGRNPAPAALIVVLAALALPAPASALTKPEYIAQADQICRSGFKAYAERARGLKTVFRRHRSHSEADQRAKLRAFGKIVGAYGETLRKQDRRLRALAAPPENAAALGAWLDLRDNAGDLYLAGARAVRHHKAARFFFTVLAATQGEKEADRYVGGFGFTSCARPAMPPQL